MKIKDNLHALKIDFVIPVTETVELARSTWVYLYFGETITLFDSGVAGSWEQIAEYIRENGRDPLEIRQVFLTHEHPDHIGGAAEIQAATNCVFAAHHDAIEWITDTDLQKKLRPVPGFDLLVGGNVEVAQPLYHSCNLKVDEALDISVYHTPGHSMGSAVFHLPQLGVLITGDNLISPGELPIYSDYHMLRSSLDFLCCIKDVEIVLSSLHEQPIVGAEAFLQQKLLASGYIEKIDSLLADGRNIHEIFDALGLSVAAITPLSLAAFDSHKREPAYLVSELEVQDPQRFHDYVTQARICLERFSGRYLYRGHNVVPLSDSWKPQRMILIEFPSVAHANRCLASGEYRRLARSREQSAHSRDIMLTQ